MDVNNIMFMGRSLLSLEGSRVIGNEAREAARGHIMKGPWKKVCNMFEGQITMEADIKQWFWSSGQDGGIGRYALLLTQPKEG